MSVNIFQEQKVDVKKIFGGGVKTKFFTITNSTGSDLDLLTGTVLGKISATGEVGIYDSTATNGLEIPFGVYMSRNHSTELLGVTISDTESVSISVIYAARTLEAVFNEKHLLLPNGETLDTEIPGKNQTIRDLLVINTNIDIEQILSNTI